MEEKEVVMRLIILLTSIFIFSIACAPALPPPDSGVEGSVTIGPMCPVVQIGKPCPNKPYQAVLSIRSSTGWVLKLQTDSQGSFHEALGPGEYVLHPESAGVMPHAADIPFTVRSHQFTRLDVIYDSGIR
jgi:hypothetical protein